MWLGRAPCRAPTLSAEQTAEQKRVHELLRFFQPVPVTVKDTKARIAKDTSLTAFAQLGALKLNCQRAFISLLDNEHQYILAEATRTVSLNSEDVHDGGDDDAVFVGATTMDLVWGICPSSIRLFSSTDGSQDIDSEYIKATKSYYIMNDLSMIPGFADRPYIAGWPYMRYYAEVPINSPSGLTIGTFCVIDNKPRAGLDKKGLLVLEEIGDSIMDHLELVMCKRQRERAERMIQSLGLFVEGRASLREWWIKSSKDSRSIDSSQRSLTLEERADIEFGLDTYSAMNEPRLESITTTGLSSNELLSSASSGGISSQSTQSYISQQTPDSSSADSQQGILNSSSQRMSIESATPIDAADDPQHSPISTPGPVVVAEMGKSKEEIAVGRDLSKVKAQSSRTNNSGRSKVSTDIEEMLSRATNLIREAVDLEGAVYYDLNLSTHEAQDESKTLVGKLHSNGTVVAKGPGEDTDAVPFSEEHVSRPLQGRTLQRVTRMCKVLAYSTRSKSTIKGDEPLANQLTLPETSLQRICQRHPHGRVLNFDKDGRLSRSDVRIDLTSDNIRPNEDSTSTQKRLRSVSMENEPDAFEDDDAEDLLRIMPGARSVFLFPLWDSNRDRWFAFSMGWTTNPNRILQLEELIYLTSFGNSVLAEVSRLDTLAADRAKADFISSISHELRSPLHGVLASAELLRELCTDSTQSYLLHTIEVCGSTLLDTMDNLLTFAKINSFSVVKRREAGAGASRLNQTASDGYRSLTTDLDIRLLVEEVVEASLAGHNFRGAAESSFSNDPQDKSMDDALQGSSKQVIVICDVEWQSNWIFNTQAGAWKRILMNLLGNALKYTESGFIHVSLCFHKDDSTADDTRSPIQVVLSVRDSGKGISEEYLKHHLYKPFAQESVLSVGTGLGLSIVRQLVSSLNGIIKITSDKGSGTYVKVSAPLSVPTAETTLIDENRLFLTGLRARLQHLRLGFTGFEDSLNSAGATQGNIEKLATSFRVLKSSLIQVVTEWFRMDVSTMTTYQPTCADIFIGPDSQLGLLEPRDINNLKNLGTRGNPPIIILCKKITSAHREMLKTREGIVYITHPFGPQKLAKALALCLEFISYSSVEDCVPENWQNACQSISVPFHVASPAESIVKTDGVNHKDVKVLAASQPEMTDAKVPSRMQIDHKSERPSRTSSPIHANTRPRVLLVEDNAINLKLLVTYMKKIYCDCETASDGLQALQVYKRNTGNFDLVFMDISMPVMDGMSSAREIREFERKESIEPTIIIALTGLASLKAQEDAYSSGIDEFWTKPVPMKKLKAIVEDRFPSVTASV